MACCGPFSLPLPKYGVSAGKRDQMVMPVVAGISSDQRRVAPPYSESWMPRCCAYQALRAFGSRARRKMPPIPVTRAMIFSLKRLSEFYSTLRRLYYWRDDEICLPVFAF